MSDQYSATVEMTDEEIDTYLQVALANGFSKGTANVSPADMKRLKPLLKHYAKKPHPFRACVRDNRKRFGPLTEKYCAIIKDLIRGTTKWRSTERKKGLSDNTLKELFGLDVGPDFIEFIAELSDEELEEIAGMDENTIDEEVETDLAQAEVAWKPEQGLNGIRRQIEDALNGGSDPGAEPVGMSYWVEDISKSEALVRAPGNETFVVPYKVKKSGVELGDQDEWKSVSQAWVEANLDQEPDLMAEMFFADADTETKADKDGLIWKPILREGTWKFSPGAGQKAVAKPIKVVKSGKSDKSGLVISMSELKKNFEAGAVEHVTIPTSHKDEVLENTGYIRKLRFAKDDDGRTVLEAGMDFTDKEVKRKAEEGSIANTSAGILFDYIHKESGKKFGSVLAHSALTNRPWLNGMKPFGVQASEDDNLQVVGFSESEYIENNPPDTGGGGEGMSETTFDLSELGFGSPEELKAAIEEGKQAKARERERDVEDKIKRWQDEGKTPAMLSEAEAIMKGDDGGSVVNFSQDGKEVALSATEIVERLVSASASVKLADDPVKDEQTSQERPDDTGDEVKLSREERALATKLFFEGNYSEEEAVEEAQRRLKSGEEK
jgi:hypothetical protein